MIDAKYLHNTNWEKIKDWEDYLISNEGKVWSIRRNKQLLVWSAPNKYPRVTLCKNGLEKSFCVHRLVALAFIPNPLNKKTVNHIDGNKNNNHAANLEWNTISENMIHAVKNGLSKPPYYGGGELHQSHKLTNVDVEMIRILLDSQEFTLKQIASRFNVHETHISNIKLKKTRVNG